jgi:serine/threonine protein kinase
LEKFIEDALHYYVFVDLELYIIYLIMNETTKPMSFADASCGLEWKKRYEIIKGICEGLLHLHDKRILHLDLKPGNILVDEHMVPKIADFGLSVCLREDQNWASTLNLYGSL